ncbi:MAG: alpha-amylase family glycosyl hydrolase [Actinomycetota bacterium]
MRIEVHAPDATDLTLVDDHGRRSFRPGAARGWWVVDVGDGDRYGIVAEGPGERCDPRRILIDPSATAVHFPDGHSRMAARPSSRDNHEIAPRAVNRPWPAARPGRRTTRPRVVCELHVRGATMTRGVEAHGTYGALAAEIPRLAALGVSVIELLPVQQFDPDEPNYWGYMPLLFGAVHDRYAEGDDPATELADLVEAAHAHDVEVWIDVVFNHTTEEDEHGPTYHLRALADSASYLQQVDGTYVNDAGTGNVVDVTDPAMRRLIQTSLDRFADLGIDGFRFDLAAILARDESFIRGLGDWAAARDVEMVAEPWDLASYRLGRAWPDPRWKQWNDRFRDDVRGFLRGEPGLVPAMIQRIQGSPDLFHSPSDTVNFLTAHDGFTMYDLVAYDRKHNEANGHGNTDGSSNNRSWNSGWEGDRDVPDAVMTLRRRRLRNAWTLLALSQGTPMFVLGDEFARTQGGNNNPYNQDNETSWVDWIRQKEWGDLEAFVGRLLDLRANHRLLSDTDRWWGTSIGFHGADGAPDLAHHSRSLAWHLGDLYVVANMWWEALDVAIHEPGHWQTLIDTTDEQGFVDPVTVDPRIRVGPRSIVVLRRAGLAAPPR